MYSASVQNSEGTVLQLTGNESAYQVLEITGLDQPAATINTTNLAGMDGSVYSSAKLNNRYIVITLRVNGDAEANRLALYDMFPTKEKVRFFYKNDTRDVYIDGYVETVGCPLFTNNETMQISLICPYPYFTDAAENMAVFTLGTHVVTSAQNDVGMRIEIEALAAFSEIVIETDRLIGDNDAFTLTADAAIGGSFVEGDIITIVTIQGRKSVKLVRPTAAYAEYNIMPCVDIDSAFLTLSKGSERYKYTVDGGSGVSKAKVTFYYAYKYRGV